MLFSAARRQPVAHHGGSPQLLMMKPAIRRYAMEKMDSSQMHQVCASNAGRAVGNFWVQLTLLHQNLGRASYVRKLTPSAPVRRYGVAL